MLVSCMLEVWICLCFTSQMLSTACFYFYFFWGPYRLLVWVSLLLHFAGVPLCLASGLQSLLSYSRGTVLIW